MIPWNRFEVFFLKIPFPPISYLNSSSNLTKFQKISRKYLNSLWIQPVFTIIPLNSLLIPQIGKFGIIFDTRPCEIDDLAVSSRYDAAKETVWLKKFITDFGVVPTIPDPIPLLCDNNGAIAQAKEPRSHQKSKHILRRFHLIREIVARGDVVVERVPSTDNVADPLTKPLAQQVFERHCITMGLLHKGNWL